MALKNYNDFFSFSNDDYNSLSKDQKLGIIDNILKELEDSKEYNERTRIGKLNESETEEKQRQYNDSRNWRFKSSSKTSAILNEEKAKRANKEYIENLNKEYDAIAKDRNAKIKQMNDLKKSIEEGKEVAFSKFKEKKYGYPTLAAEDWDAMDKEFAIATGKQVTTLPENENKKGGNEQAQVSEGQSSGQPNKTSESNKSTSSASNATKSSNGASDGAKDAYFNQSFYNTLKGNGQTVYENLGDKRWNGKLVRKEMEGVRRLQEKYKKAGLYNGPLDGIWGKETQAAYLKWQEMKNKPATETQKSSTTSTTTSTTPVANENKEGVKVSTASFDFMKAIDEDYRKKQETALAYSKEKEKERELELVRNAREGDINSMLELTEIDRQKKKKLREKESKQKQAIAEHEKFLKENGIIPSL